MTTQNHRLPPGTILILNGTSSSGKTTLLKALQARFDEPFLDMGIDSFIWMLPKRYLDRPLWDDVLGLAVSAGQSGHRLATAMQHAIATVARLGNHVVADHVLVESAWVQECAQLFSEMPAWLIGVRCPLEIVEQREAARKDRTLGQARAQYSVVHAHGCYDLEVDTSLFSPEECAQQIQQHLQSGQPPTAFKRLHQWQRQRVV